MIAINRLRERGYSVWLASGGRIAIKPKLPTDWRTWVASNRLQLINELQQELSARNAKAELQRCSKCQHDKRSSVNPKGGLSWCDVRCDVPPMLPGSRFLACSQFVEASNTDEVKP